MKTIHLNVTKQLIAQATRKDSNHCMIADAVRKLFPAAKYIKVDTQSVRFSDIETQKRHFYFTPPVAQLALVNFDKGKPVKPFAFTLSDGITKPMGWSQNHPNSSRKGAKYRKTSLHRIVPKRERVFGLRAITA